MKLIIDIDEETYIKAQAGILGSFGEIIANGIPYEERPQSSLERPLYKGVLFVDDYGINKVIEVDNDGNVTAQMVIPRDTFIEAYNKFIKGE